MKLTNAVELVDETMANCYVATVDNRTILIDAGMKSSSKKIINYFESSNRKPDIVLITHCHIDHIGGLSNLEEKFHPQIYVPDKEIEIAKGNEKMPSAKSMLSSMVGLTRARPVNSARPLSEFELSGLRKIDTNGHTPGSTSYLFDELRAIFVGDAVSKNGDKYEFNKSFTLDPTSAERSIKMILEFHGITAYPGHGQPFLIP